MTIDKNTQGWEQSLVQMMNGEHATLNILKQHGIRVKSVKDSVSYLHFELEEPKQEIRTETYGTPAPSRAPEAQKTDEQEHSFAAEEPAEPGVVCTFCESTKVEKRGVRDTRYGPKQRYHCINCDRKFVVEPDAFKKATPEILALVKELADKGLSSRSIVAALDYKFKLKVAPQTVLNWIVEAGGVPQVSGSNQRQTKLGRPAVLDEKLEPIILQYAARGLSGSQIRIRIRDQYKILVARETILRLIRERKGARAVADTSSEGSIPKSPTEMTWPEMQQAYREKRQEQPKTEKPKKDDKQPRYDWPKILDGIRDILFDAKEPMSASAIRRELGDDAPAVAGIIDHLYHDERFHSDEEKRWSLAKEGADDETETEEDLPKKGVAPVERARW